ncbi:hypothetical protein HOP52_16175 [Halomonas campisalis]|uniref:Uncharacterized protein n=1 Tax=Billgrantia campisalis TaxID=74661 RepID=A0ABS9PC13_9GAMM|nr:hypothetical protein [Halomonas campisalis]MCG6659296.1 hypothetical protein [Halomonas campisalis]MDR5864295.1 hypothetical protein [Halomonas campisalis]
MTEPTNVRAMAGKSPQLLVTQVEAALVAASEQIGGIAEMAHWAVAGLAVRVERRGKAVSELTVGELLAMLDDQRQRHHRVFGGEPHE